MLSGCAASVNTVSRVTCQDPTFDLVKLQQGGLAILPILAGAGVEGYRRPFGESINVQADSLYGAEHVVHRDAAMTAINGAGLSGREPPRGQWQARALRRSGLK